MKESTVLETPKRINKELYQVKILPQMRKMNITAWTMISICLVHLIMQVQAQPMENSPTSLPLTFQPLNKTNNDTNSTEQRTSKYRRNNDYDIQNDEEISEDDELWEIAQNNEWYRWATFTARVSGFCCVSSVPASCVHIWFVSCPCFMSL